MVALHTEWLGQAWRQVFECRSTNDEALVWARAGAPIGAVVVAERQTAGRGRQGRTWVSPAGDNLYFSTVLRPPLKPSDCALLPLVVGVAVAETLQAVGAAPELKWPNDVLLDGKKVAGILAEAHWQGERVRHIVVGIGVNLNAIDMPIEIASIATSFRRSTGQTISSERFAALLCENLEREHDQWVAQGAAPVLDQWRRFARWGRAVSVQQEGQLISGVALDLDASGALLVRDDGGRQHRLWSGEIGFVEEAV